MAMFTPSFSGLRGRVLFSLLFAVPMIYATDSVTTKDGRTVTVTADANTATEATDGYQPLSTSTAALTDTSVLDTPQVVNTISDQIPEDQNATTSDEALYNVSNVIQTNTLGETRNTFVRRGLGANRDGSIMINGLRTVLSCSFSAVTERAEVLKGPASTLYGILDLSGLINVVTKRPEKTFHGSVPATPSSFGSGTGQLDITGPIEGTQLAYRPTKEMQDEDYWRSFGREYSTFIAPSLTWFGDNAIATMLYSRRDYETPSDHGTVLDLTTKQSVNIDRKIRFNEPFNITDGQSDLVQLSAEYRLNSQRTVRLDYSYSQGEYSNDQARVTAYGATTGALTRRVDATQGFTQRMHATHAGLQGNVDIAGFYNGTLGEVSYGYYDLLRTDMIHCKKVKDFNIYNPAYGNTNKYATASAPDNDQTIKQESYSACAQDTFYLTDNQITVVGVRYQYYTQYAGKDRPFNVNTDSRGEQWTPKLGLVYKLTPSVSLFANYSRTFMPQSLITSYIGDLPPESSNAYEVGARFRLFDGITANTVLSDIHKRNVLCTESTDDEAIVKMTGRACSRGAEADLAKALTENVNIIASYGYTDTKVLEDPDYTEKPLPNVPRHTGSLFLTYNIHNMPSNNTLTFGGGGHGVSRRSATDGVDYYLPGYFVADTFTAYKIKSQYPVILQLNVKNPFDKTYYTSPIVTDNLGNQIDDPREVQFTAKMES